MTAAASARTPEASLRARPAQLVATGINVSFGALQVLSNLSVEVSEGELVGIIGPNGAGKTTLFSVLVGALRPRSGSVAFDGHDVTGLPVAARCRQGLVRTHQIPRPFNEMTVFENVLVAASVSRSSGRQERQDRQDRAIASLAYTEMLWAANRRAGELGLLDRKRLELSRALATQPKMLLLDEIGGGLSDVEALELLDMIRALSKQGITIVWVEHIVSLLLKGASRLLCLHGGRIIADGRPEAVIEDPVVRSAYLGGGIP